MINARSLLPSDKNQPVCIVRSKDSTAAIKKIHLLTSSFFFFLRGSNVLEAFLQNTLKEEKESIRTAIYVVFSTKHRGWERER